ncbi:MAG TPA: hypothetical protein VK034_12245 [Enhygromyxa sp.]|nr:hypothetical protein [Enhygromyxa sp.]
MGSQVESEASGYRYLCTSVPAACEYAPPTAPGYKADVCWDGTAAYVMPASGCAPGQWPYFLEAGEVVDPLTNQVQGYIPLDDGCDLGYCTVKPPGAGPTEPGPMCCSANGCTTTAYDDCTGANEVLVWCADGEEPQNQGGEWVCYEAD